MEDKDKLPLGKMLFDQAYEIIGYLGYGGFSITYLAKELKILRSGELGEKWRRTENPETVVIKEFFDSDLCERDYSTGRLLLRKPTEKARYNLLLNNQKNEGKKLHNLEHKHVVGVRTVFLENETSYLVMDYIQGSNLYDYLESHKLPGKLQTFNYFHQVLDALNYLHHQPQKIIHSDVSPGNIIINEKSHHVTLIDFGISIRYDEHDDRKSTFNEITGKKERYSPFEQGAKESMSRFNATIDTYATTATLYYLLTGLEVPSARELIQGTPIPSLKGRIADEEWSPFLDAIIKKGLSVQPLERFQTAEDLNSALLHEPDYHSKLVVLKKLKEGHQTEAALNYIAEHMSVYLIVEELSQIQATLDQELLEFNDSIKNILKLDHEYLEAFEDKDYKKAMELLEEIQLIRPEHPKLQKRILACREELQKAEASNNRYHELLREAAKYQRENLFDKALSLLDEAKELMPTIRVIAMITRHQKAITAEQSRFEEKKLISDINKFIADKNYPAAEVELETLATKFKNEDKIKELRVLLDEKKMIKPIIDEPQKKDVLISFIKDHPFNDINIRKKWGGLYHPALNYKVDISVPSEVKREEKTNNEAINDLYYFAKPSQSGIIDLDKGYKFRVNLDFGTESAKVIPNKQIDKYTYSKNLSDFWEMYKKSNNNKPEGTSMVKKSTIKPSIVNAFAAPPVNEATLKKNRFYLFQPQSASKTNLGTSLFPFAEIGLILFANKYGKTVVIAVILLLSLLVVLWYWQSFSFFNHGQGK